MSLKRRNRDIKPVKAGSSPRLLYVHALDCMLQRANRAPCPSLRSRWQGCGTAAGVWRAMGRPPCAWMPCSTTGRLASARRALHRAWLCFSVPQPASCTPRRRDRLVELWRLIAEEQAAALGKATPSAFVTFRTRKAQARDQGAERRWAGDLPAWLCRNVALPPCPSRPQVVAAHSLLSHDPSAWRCRPAPGADEVVWANVG